MPRRNGRFQQALVVWYKANRSRFLIPATIKMVRDGRVEIKLLGQPACLSITADQTNLSVWVTWQGVNWDALLDLDVLPVKTPGGYRCKLCDGLPVKEWPNLQTLWVDHLFEEFLIWVNERYAQATSIMLSGHADSFSTAKLSGVIQLSSDLTTTTFEISLHRI